jgi:hypothetical protein
MNLQTKPQPDAFHAERYLILYPSEHRYLASATSDGSKTECVFRDFAHPFQSPEPKHLTREHVVIYATQGLCVHMGAMTELKADVPVTSEEFIKALLDETALIKSITLRFERVIPRHQEIGFHIQTIRYGHVGHTFFMEAEFVLPSGCVGTVKAGLKF